MNGIHIGLFGSAIMMVFPVNNLGQLVFFKINLFEREVFSVLSFGKISVSFPEVTLISWIIVYDT
jgi:hypothetical protein